MAVLTASGVTLLRSYDRVSRGKLIENVKKFSLVLSSMGDVQGDIPASLLGFAEISSAVVISYLVGGSPRGVIVTVGVNGTELVPCNILEATDANRGNRAALTGTLIIEIAGRPQ